MQYQQHHENSAGGRIRAVFGWRILATLAALASIAGAGVLATRAALSDQVTMGQITVAGGTLDMVANSETDDTDVAWAGSLSVALTGMAPGDLENERARDWSRDGMPVENTFFDDLRWVAQTCQIRFDLLD